jgi:choline dehydrogenase-like flavoprotein
MNGEVFNYPGLYVMVGSITPANPGVNPALTITVLAEYAMRRIAAKGYREPRISRMSQMAESPPSVLNRVIHG